MRHRKLSNVEFNQVCSSQRALDTSFIKYKVVTTWAENVQTKFAFNCCRNGCWYTILFQAVKWSEKQTNQLIVVCFVDFSKFVFRLINCCIHLLAPEYSFLIHSNRAGDQTVWLNSHRSCNDTNESKLARFSLIFFSTHKIVNVINLDSVRFKLDWNEIWIQNHSLCSTL